MTAIRPRMAAGSPLISNVGAPLCVTLTLNPLHQWFCGDSSRCITSAGHCLITRSHIVSVDPGNLAQPTSCFGNISKHPVQPLIPLGIKAIQSPYHDGISNHSRVGRIVCNTIGFIAFLQFTELCNRCGYCLEINFKIMTRHHNPLINGSECKSFSVNASLAYFFKCLFQRI